MMLGLAASLSRTAILFFVLIIGQTLFFIRLRRPKLPVGWILGVLAALILATVVLLAFNDEINSIISSLDSSFLSRAFTVGTLSDRLSSWTRAVTDINYWTPLGYGYGVGISTLRRKYNLAFELYSHDEYSALLLEQGIVGLICFLGFLASWIQQSYRNIYYQRDRKVRFTGAAMLAICSATLITAIMGTMLKVSPINVYFWLFAGILARSPLFANWARPATSEERLTLTNPPAVSIAKHGHELA
jgi:hypothetical protein